MEYTRGKRWQGDLTSEAGDKLFYKYLEPSLTPRPYDAAIQRSVPVRLLYQWSEPVPRGIAASGNAVIAPVWRSQQREVFYDVDCS